MRGSKLDPGKVGGITTLQLGDGQWRGVCRVLDYDGGLRMVERCRRTKRACEDATKQAAQALRDRLKTEYEIRNLARKDAERGLTGQNVDPTTVRALAAEWRAALATNQHLHVAAFHSWERLLAAMFGEPTRLRADDGSPVARRVGPREAFSLIADELPRLVTARDLKDVLGAVSRTNGSSTARQLRAVLSYIFGLAEDKGLVVANPVPLLRGNKGSPVIQRNKVNETGLNYRRSPSVEVVEAL